MSLSTQKPWANPSGTSSCAVRLVVELVALPLAERRRAGADVDDHVEDRAAHAAHELRLAGLEMHPADDARAASASGCPERKSARRRPLVEHVRAEALQEEAALVTVHDGLENERPLQRDLGDLHGTEGKGLARMTDPHTSCPALASAFAPGYNLKCTQ